MKLKDISMRRKLIGLLLAVGLVLLALAVWYGDIFRPEMIT